MPGRGAERRPSLRPVRPGNRPRPDRRQAAAANDNDPPLGRQLASILRWAALALLAIAAVWMIYYI